MENAQENQAVTTVSQDLLDKVQAAKALVTAHSLLGVGMFQFRHQEALKQSIEFLANLHKQVLDDALSHPEADKVADLVQYKAEKEAQAQLQQLLKEQAEKEQSQGQE